MTQKGDGYQLSHSLLRLYCLTFPLWLSRKIAPFSSVILSCPLLEELSPECAELNFLKLILQTIMKITFFKQCCPISSQEILKKTISNQTTGFLTSNPDPTSESDQCIASIILSAKCTCFKTHGENGEKQKPNMQEKVGE